MTDRIYKLNKTSRDIEVLLYCHKNLVYHMLTEANQLHNQDAESAAWEGLWDAINLFDVFSKVKFSTYACVVIRNVIYDVLRKQQTYNDHWQVYDVPRDIVNYECVDSRNNEAINNIYDIFNKYLHTKEGNTKNILLAWYSLGFGSTTINIGAMCNCSPSYVSRVQNAFRAHITTQLKGD